jgi:hypothetical protein
VLEAPRKTQRQSLAALMKAARGAVDSGVPDLDRIPSISQASVTMRAMLFSTERNVITAG